MITALCFTCAATSIQSGLTQIIMRPQLKLLQDQCPGEIISITCETRGSPILAWTSDEYIEQGGTQLAFGTFNAVNFTRVSPVNPNTIATLIENTVENGVSVLVSTLRIKALSAFLSSSVNCIHSGNGNTNSSRVQVIGMWLVSLYLNISLHILKPIM